VGTTVPVPPSAPATLVATAPSSSRIDLSWAASSGATGYLIERKSPGDANYVQIAGPISGTTYANTGLAASTSYSYRVRAVNGAGNSAYSPLASAITKANVPTPTTLTGVDIGGAKPTGSTTEITPGRDYNITAGGVDISGGIDQMHFAYKQVTGDFDVKVRINSLTQQDVFTKAGILARASLTTGASYVGVLLTPSDRGARLQVRRTEGGITEASGSGSAPAVFPNEWLRLKRVGDVFTSYRSKDGVTWTAFKGATVTLPQTLYLGLAATSHNTAATTTAQFRDFGNV
jgi:regulation of enolase protein 1 (concanavalin A-like superfamily)